MLLPNVFVSFFVKKDCILNLDRKRYEPADWMSRFVLLSGGSVNALGSSFGLNPSFARFFAPGLSVLC